MIDFYKNKSSELPRFFYRNYLAYIKQYSLKNKDAIDLFEKSILNSVGGDFLKFTWNLPIEFNEIFSSEELKILNEIIKNKRNKRPKKLVKHIFPHVSDEFSLSNDFLSSIFDRSHLPTINKNDIFFTMGSCFARNFSTYLKGKGIHSKNLGQSEDLNTPGCNASLLNYAAINNEGDLKNKLYNLINIYWPELSEESKASLLLNRINEIKSVKDIIKSSTKIIITLGNVVDFYKSNNDHDELIPKFIALNQSEDINERNHAAARMKKAGAFIRLSRFDETKKHIYEIYNSIRKISLDCSIIFTVSPVPIDSILGISEPLDLSATEIDCISKSTIRSALYETAITETFIKDKNVFYLPSYEIVRWIAPVLGVPLFGKEDAASRHVSNAILNGICDFIYDNNNSF